MKKNNNQYFSKSINKMISILTGINVGIIIISYAYSTSSLLCFPPYDVYISKFFSDLFLAIIFSLFLFVLLNKNDVIITSPSISVALVLSTGNTFLLSFLTSENSLTEGYATICATFFIATIFNSTILFLIGFFNLARFMRYIPFPLIGGFAASVGILLFKSGLKIMLGSRWMKENLINEITNYKIYWIPGISLAILIFIAKKIYKSFDFNNIIFIGGCLIFYMALYFLNLSPSEALEQGLLLGPFKSSGELTPDYINYFDQIQWKLIFNNLIIFLPVFVVIAINVLMEISFQEEILKKDLDISKHVCRIGGVGFLSALMGGGLSQYSESLTITIQSAEHKKLAVNSSLFFCLLIWLWGAELAAWIPRAVVGGVITSIGLGLFYYWIIESRNKIPLIDYFLMLFISTEIVFFGLAYGVAIGLLIGIILFIIDYSSVKIIRHHLKSNEYPYIYQFNEKQINYLEQSSNRLHILELQGFIFFGTCYELYMKIKEIQIHSKNKNNLIYVIFDFDLVTGIDYSSTNSFEKIKSLLKEKSIYAMFTNCSTKIMKNLALAGYNKQMDSHYQFLPNLSEAVQKARTLILEEAGFIVKSRPKPIIQMIHDIFPKIPHAEILLTYLEYFEVKIGQELHHVKDGDHDLYLVEKGMLSLWMKSTKGSQLCLCVATAGQLIGTLMLFENRRACTVIRCDEDGVVYRLSLTGLRKMEKKEPELAAAIEHVLASDLAKLANQSMTIIQALIH